MSSSVISLAITPPLIGPRSSEPVGPPQAGQEHVAHGLDGRSRQHQGAGARLKPGGNTGLSRPPHPVTVWRAVSVAGGISAHTGRDCNGVGLAEWERPEVRPPGRVARGVPAAGVSPYGPTSVDGGAREVRSVGYGSSLSGYSVWPSGWWANRGVDRACTGSALGQAHPPNPVLWKSP